MVRNKMTKIIGVTGGVGCGKTAVLQALAESLPCLILYADDIAKELEEPGMPCYAPLLHALGEEGLLAEDGRIDRAEMARRIFADPSLLQEINAIVHPAVRRYVEEEIAAAKEEEIPYVFLEAALLIEAGYLDLLDALWVVTAPREVRVQRLMASRGYSEEKCQAIMASQLQEEDFRRYADAVLDNGGSMEETLTQAKDLLSLDGGAAGDAREEEA